MNPKKKQAITTLLLKHGAKTGNKLSAELDTEETNNRKPDSKQEKKP